MIMERFTYDSDTAPSLYACTACDQRGVRLWRDYNTAATAVEMKCVKCAEPDAVKRASLIECDQIGGLVPAIPTEDGDTFWGYSSVPSAGVEWWYRLPCAADVRPSRQALTAVEARRQDAAFAIDKAERRAKDNATAEQRLREAFAVVEATSHEQHMLWRDFHYKPAGHAPVSWEQVNVGMSRQIGTFGGMPVCVTVFFAVVDGALVAFYDSESMVTHSGMTEEWCRKAFVGARSWSNAQNFHNTLIDIRHRRESTKAATA